MRSLQDKVSNLSGIGPKKELALKALGIETIEDLLCYYPFRYEDMATKEVSELADGQKAVIQGVVATAPVVVRFGRAKNRLNFKLLAGHDVIQITFFGQAYLKDRVQPGSDVAVYGKYDTARQSMTGMKLFSNGGSQEDIAGVYRASKKIKAQMIKQLVKKAYEEYQNGGLKRESQMSYADYLDYWMEEYFEINFKYSTAKRYKESFETIKKELGKYKLCDITPYLLNKTLLGLYQKTQTKETLRNYQKVIKSSLRDATYYFGFIGNDPAGSLQIPKILTFESKKTMPNMCIQ